MTKRARKAAPHRQTCKVCGSPEKFDFQVSDEIWAAVVPPPYEKSAVCLYCFDDFARERRVQYAHHVGQIYFAGEQASLVLDVTSAADS